MVIQVFGRSFPHQRHVVAASLECQSCHTTHEERVESGMDAVRITAGSCESCHHGEAGHSCLDCHSVIMERAFDSELGDFEHAAHVREMEIQCAECHGEAAAMERTPDFEVCSACH